MRIEVTADDIFNGVCKSFKSCPVALAILRASGQQCLVGAFRVERPDGGTWVNHDFVHDFITAFDRGDTVTPFAFELPEDFLGVKVS